MNGLNSNHTTKPFKIKRPTPMERTHRATIKLYVDHTDGVYIAKNRYGVTGKIGTKDLVDILSHVLAEQVFDGRTIIFQEGMKIEIEKAINQIIKKGYFK